MTSKIKVVLTASLCLTGLQLLSACSDDDDSGDKQQQADAGGGDAGDSTPDGGAGGNDAGGDGAVATPERYALASQVFGASDQTSYLVLHEGDLFAADTIALTGGIERAGRALTVAGPAAGSVYYAGDKLADVDRYDLNSGELELTDTVSFGTEGVTGIGEYPGQLVFVSESKALYFDARTLKVLVWNPQDMTLTTAIDVSDLTVDGFSGTFSTLSARRGDKVFMPVGYRTPAAVPSNAAVVVVDTSNNTAKVVKDTRCGYVRDSVEGDDGKLYLATEAFASAVHHLNSTAAPKPCLLRFDLDAESYDPDFFVDLNALNDGKTTGSLVALPNGKFYTRWLDESKVPVLAMPSGRALASAIAWGWAEITLGDSPALTPVADAYVMGGSHVPFLVGNKLVMPDFAADQSKTTLCDMSEGPYCATKVDVQGLIFSLAKLN